MAKLSAKLLRNKAGFSSESVVAIIYMLKKVFKLILSIPVHGNRDLPIGTLTRLMKDANLTEEDLKK